MCLLRIGLLACHLFGVPSQMEHSRFEESGGDPVWRRHREGVSWAEGRRRICTDGRFSDGHARTCDELMERYYRHDED